MLVWSSPVSEEWQEDGAFAAQDSKPFSLDGTVCLIAQSDGELPQLVPLQR